MFRFLSRASGLLLVAGGFILGVIDGTRSIADSTLTLTPLGATLSRLAGQDVGATIGPVVARNIHPLAWDPALIGVLQVPTAAMMIAIGFIFLWLGRPRQAPIGFDTKR